MTAATVERGSAAVELVLVTPLLMLFLSFVLFGGRLMIATTDVDGAARSSARAASLARDATGAAAAAEATARAELDRTGVPCSDVRVETDTAAFGPGSLVTVALQCDVPLGDLGLLGLGGHRTVSARQAVVIDQYRGLE